VWPFSKKKLQTPHTDTRVDGWFSSLTGFGITGRDKRTSVSHDYDVLSHADIESLWRGNDIAARIIEKLPDEALREGFEIKTDDKELSEEIMGTLEESGAIEAFKEAAKFERGFGGGALYPVVNDGNKNLSEPLNEDRIPEVSHFITLEPRELTPIKWYSSISDKKFGEPSHYQILPQGRAIGPVQHILIHESRLISFPGIRVSRNQLSSANNHWGDSALMRPYEILRDFGIAWAATSALLHEFSQASLKIKGLAELIAADGDEQIKTRIRAVELSRSTINAVLMDADEEYERKQTPVAGLSDLLTRFATRLAAAADMPVTLLMGQSPAGLNATGESDIRFWYDRVASYQELHLKCRLERLIKFFLISNAGPTKGKEPESWSIEFKALWQPSEKEVADTRAVVANTDKTYIDAGVLSPLEVAKSRFGGDTYSMETIVDFDEREELEKIEEEQMLQKLMEQEQAEKQKLELLQGGKPEDEIPPPPSEPAEDDDREDAYVDIEVTDDDGVRIDFVVERNGKYVVLSKSGNILGTHDTKEKAIAQLRRIEAAKHATK